MRSAAGGAPSLRRRRVVEAQAAAGADLLLAEDPEQLEAQVWVAAMADRAASLEFVEYGCVPVTDRLPHRTHCNRDRKQ